MPRHQPDRKARFKAALALAGVTAEEWAAEERVTTGHLYQVLGGKRESTSLVERIDRFIDQYLGKVAA